MVTTAENHPPHTGSPGAADRDRSGPVVMAENTRPATKKQVAANRLNGLRARGPATLQGKSASAQNAVKHGLLSTKLSALTWEDPDELAHLRQVMTAELQPQGAFETALVEQVIDALWKMKRLSYYEDGVAAYHYLRTIEQRERDNAAGLVRAPGRLLDSLPGNKKTIVNQVLHDHHQQNARQIHELQQELLPSVGEAFIRDVEGPNAMAKVRRYQAALENSFYRAYHELQRVQAARRGSPVILPEAVDIGVSITAPAGEGGPDEDSKGREATEGSTHD